MWKTLCNCGKESVDNIVFVVYNRGINIKRKDDMSLKDEIERINNQSKQIAEIRKEIIEDMKKL